MPSGPKRRARREVREDRLRFLGLDGDRGEPSLLEGSRAHGAAEATLALAMLWCLAGIETGRVVQSGSGDADAQQRDGVIERRPNRG